MVSHQTMTPFPIETPRLLLIPAQLVHLQAALIGRAELEKYIGYAVHPDWTEFGSDPWAYALRKIRENESQSGWWTWFPALKSEELIIGTCGYKGLPDANGQVEIGYEIAPPFRHQGLATEIATGLVGRVRNIPLIQGVLAHTLPEENASVRVLKKAGFSLSGEIEDPDDGPVWRWQLTFSCDFM